MPDGVTWYNPSYKYITNIKNIENLTGLSLLSNLRLSENEINDIKESSYTDPTRWEDFPDASTSLSANLLSAGYAENSVAVIAADSTIEQSYIADNYSRSDTAISDNISVGEDVHDSFTQIYSSQISTIEGSETKIGTIQDGLNQVGINKISFDKASSTQVGSTQVGSFQGTFSQTSSTQVGSTQVGIVQIGRIENTSTQVGSTQIGSFQVSTKEVSSTQIGVAKIDFGKVSTDKLDSTQVNITKIPLPSSVPSSQFFSIHTLTPESITTIDTS